MRKQKTIKIDGKEITIRELKVKEIYRIISGAFEIAGKKEQDGEQSLEAFGEEISNFLTTYLPLVTKDITHEDALDMAPSELEELYEAFKEVNKTFFTVLQKVGAGNLLQEIKKAIAEDFSKLYADSFNRVTQTHGTTALKLSK